jgi:hypothetical protein
MNKIIFENETIIIQYKQLKTCIQNSIDTILLERKARLGGLILYPLVDILCKQMLLSWWTPVCVSIHHYAIHNQYSYIKYMLMYSKIIKKQTQVETNQLYTMINKNYKILIGESGNIQIGNSIRNKDFLTNTKLNNYLTTKYTQIPFYNKQTTVYNQELNYNIQNLIRRYLYLRKSRFRLYIGLICFTSVSIICIIPNSPKILTCSGILTGGLISYFFTRKSAKRMTILEERIKKLINYNNIDYYSIDTFGNIVGNNKYIKIIYKKFIIN